MKRLKIFLPDGQVKEFAKGERADKPYDDFVSDIQIHKETKAVIVKYNQTTAHVYSGLPYEYYEMHEEKDSYFLKS